MNKIEPSELIINKDGSIFHLHLKPEDIADIIILVGDPNRVNVIAEFFNEIELKNRTESSIQSQVPSIIKGLQLFQQELELTI